tara:strand:- start:1450 stop:1605 length:156 start_codon:yes stop_codon:yes gene_type:complete
MVMKYVFTIMHEKTIVAGSMDKALEILQEKTKLENGSQFKLERVESFSDES